MKKAKKAKADKVEVPPTKPSIDITIDEIDARILLGNVTEIIAWLRGYNAGRSPHNAPAPQSRELFHFHRKLVKALGYDAELPF